MLNILFIIVMVAVIVAVIKDMISYIKEIING